MKTRSEFAKDLADLSLTHEGRAVALLWYYRQSQEFDERSARELVDDLHEEGFPRTNVTRLRNYLKRSRFTIQGQRHGTFQIDVRRLRKLDAKYATMLDLRKVEVSDTVLPKDLVEGTRAYLESLVHQINGAYDNGFYDACAVL